MSNIISNLFRKDNSWKNSHVKIVSTETKVSDNINFSTNTGKPPIYSYPKNTTFKEVFQDKTNSVKDTVFKTNSPIADARILGTLTKSLNKPDSEPNYVYRLAMVINWDKDFKYYQIHRPYNLGWYLMKVFGSSIIHTKKSEAIAALFKMYEAMNIPTTDINTDLPVTELSIYLPGD